MKSLQKIATFPLILTLGIAVWYFVFHLLPAYDIKTAGAGLEPLDERWLYTRTDVFTIIYRFETHWTKLVQRFFVNGDDLSTGVWKSDHFEYGLFKRENGAIGENHRMDELFTA